MNSNQHSSSDQSLTERIRSTAREGLAILLLALCTFLFVALTSYDKADGRWSSAYSPEEPINLMGSFGAFVSDLMYSGLGYSAYLFPILFLGLALVKLGKRSGFRPEWPVVAIRSAGFLCLLISTSTLGSLHFFHPESALPNAAGGALGESITSALSGFGLLGATMVMLAIWMAGFTLLTGWSWLRVMDEAGFYGEKFGMRVYNWLRQEAKDSSAGLPEHYSAPETKKPLFSTRPEPEKAELKPENKVRKGPKIHTPYQGRSSSEVVAEGGV